MPAWLVPKLFYFRIYWIIAIDFQIIVLQTFQSQTIDPLTFGQQTINPELSIPIRLVWFTVIQP